MPPAADPAQPPLDRLPVELLAAVLSFLPGRDIKNLRLTSKSVCSRTPLRLYRVFLSANPRNIEVLRAIADHDGLRHGVFEIVLDDALLGHISNSEPQSANDLGEDGDDTDSEEDTESRDSTDGEGGEEDIPYAFDRVCKQNIRQALERQDTDIPRPNQILIAQQIKQELPRRNSWRYYRQLLQQQEHVITTEADIEAFRYGLEHFTSLQRVTITPTAHGVLYEPLYETPMIRAFPRGFNYPIPCSWPLYEIGRPYTLQSWDNDDESDKSRWRGFSIATGELTTFGQRVKDLVIDVAHLTTGLSCRFFTRPCQEYDNLLGVLRQPGFSRIDLSILADGQQYKGWPVLRNGRLKAALDAAADLQHVSLGVQIDPPQLARAFRISTSPSNDHFTPLRDIFPIDRWPKLRHFGLSNFLVQQDDLLLLLAALPLTLRSVDLSFLTFIEGGDYRGLLDGIRQNLAWHERPVHERPRVFVNVRNSMQVTIRYFCLDKEVNEFFYGTGENPFELEGSGRNYPHDDMGIIRDPFDPTHDRPNTGIDELMEMGIVSE